MTEGHTERLEAALAGRYKIERKLGEGGMASVYLAEDLKHKRRVALKILRPELAAVIGAERFLAEIQTTANLQHPHILPLFDSGSADGYLYYVMPFIDGETLRDKLDREKQLGVEESLRIARDVADALDYAHRQGVIHRDIKPGNILLHDGRPVVADFGIALAVSAAGGGRMTETGLSLGTPHCMSPEQASADRDLSARSDVYSLGCVLYEMLAGQPPHTGPSAQSILVHILTEEPKPLTSLRHTVPPNVAAAVAKAIEKLPADRFESARQLAEALADPGFGYRARATAGAPGATVASPGGATRPWLRDPRSLAALAVIALLVVGNLAGPRSVAPGPPFNLDLSLGDARFIGGGDMLISPDGDRFVFAGRPPGDGGTRRLYARRSDEVDFREIPGVEAVTLPALSPDGRFVAYRDMRDNTLHAVALDGGAPFVIVAQGELGEPGGFDWGADGTLVVTAAGGLFAVPATGGRPTLLLDAPPGTADHPRWLPGQKAVLFTNSVAGSLSILDLSADSVRPAIAQGIDGTYVETGHILYGTGAGELLAVPFDPDRLEITGEPMRILDDLWVGSPANAYADARYSVSRNGTLVYGVGDASGSGEEAGEYRLLIAPLTGSAVDSVPVGLVFMSPPRWSPDGGSIAYAQRGPEGLNVFTYDLRGGTLPRQVTYGGNDYDPVWSPGGDRIAFASARGPSRSPDLYMKDLGSDAPEVALLETAATVLVRQWPLDSLILVEGGASQARSEIWTVPPRTGAGPTTYLAEQNDIDDPALSPDGRWMAYQMNTSGVEALFVRRYPEGGQPVRVSEGEGQFPRWSSDGAALYYWGAEDAVADTLWRATFTTEPTFVLRQREPVLSGDFRPEMWDLHPSGDRIVVGERLAAEAEAPPRFRVVTNFFDELRRRAPTD